MGLANIANGGVIHACREADCEATYECNQGFILDAQSGDMVRTCTGGNGTFEWDGTEPSCTVSGTSKLTASGSKHT